MTTAPQPTLSASHDTPEISALEQVRRSAQALMAEGKTDEAIDYFVSALAAMLRRTKDLELLVAKLRSERVGTRSERIDPRQLEMLFEQLRTQGGSEVAVDAQAEAREDAALEQQIKDAQQFRKPSSGRRPRRLRVRDAERHVHHLGVPEAERICSTCNEEKKRIGADVSWRLEFVPGHFVEHEYRKDKYSCPKCREGVTTARAPAAIINRSDAGASLLAHVVVSKHVDHCPLHRLEKQYARSGVDLSVSTLSDWMAQVADMATPLVDKLSERVLGTFVVRTDATGLKVLDPSSPNNIERGTMWCYVGDDRDVVFRYAPTGEGVTGPWEFLKGRKGYVQADAASVFDRLYNGEVASAIELGCWCHGRRKFVALQDMDCRVAYPLKLIRRLYRIERLANLKELSFAERTLLRQERSQPVLDKLKRWLVATTTTEPPSADLAKATAYFLNHWTALTRFVEDGRLDLDNNLCERQMRAIALGRRNHLFAGSHKAAARAAVLYSITRTCAQHDVLPLPYLTDVLRKLAEGWPQSRIEELLPDRWKAAQATSA